MFLDKFATSEIVSLDVNGKKNGEYTKRETLTDRPVEQGFYKNGKKIGLWKTYYSDSEAMFAQALAKKQGKESKAKAYTPATEGHYEDGKKVGTWYYYSIDGELKTKAEFVNDVMHGRCEDHEKNSLFHYNNGKKEGDFICWNDDGSEFIRGQYKNDVEDGLWIYKTKEGAIYHKVAFKNGEIISLDEFYAEITAMQNSYFDSQKTI